MQHSQSAPLLAHVWLSPYISAQKQTLPKASLLSVCFCALLHCSMLEHVFDKYPVPFGGVVDENVGDSADDLTVLYDG